MGLAFRLKSFKRCKVFSLRSEAGCKPSADQEDAEQKEQLKALHASELGTCKTVKARLSAHKRQSRPGARYMSDSQGQVLAMA